MVSVPTGLRYWPNSNKSKELPWKGQGDAKEKETRKKVNNHGGQQMVTRGEVSIKASKNFNVGLSKDSEQSTSS